MDRASLTVYTIGHSNHPLREFIDLLTEHQISTLIDVRSRPYSRWFPHFNKRSLQQSLGENEIGYHFAGNELGGKPDDPALYDESGNPRYDLISARSEYRDGIRDVLDLAAKSRIALMCAEEDPGACHRYRLVGQTLADYGVTMLHIRRTGEVQRNDEI